jgi:hypothetical protein
VRQDALRALPGLNLDLHAEVALEDLFGAQIATSAAIGDTAMVEEVNRICKVQRTAHILLNYEERRAFASHLLEELEEAVDYQGC